ncbi:M16 family metallopeptidase [Streptomyces sp. 900105755]
MDRVVGQSGVAATRASTPWRFPEWRTLNLHNGMTVRLIDMPGRYVATVAVSIRLPTAVEDPATEGAVAAYTTMMLSDAPHLRSAGVSEVARIGATITTGCDHRGPKVIADCPAVELPRLLAALAAMLLRFEPTPRSFEACKQRLAAERALEVHDPSALANKLFSESVLAPATRYARPVGGTDATWRQLSLEDVAHLRQQHVGPQHMTVIIAGDLSLVDAEAEAVRFFDHFPQGTNSVVPDRAPQPAARPQLMWRAGTEGAQTRLMMGCFAIDRLDPRWPSARVAAELLGGGADGLINKELRGRLGLSYGIDVRFVPYFSGGLFLMAGSVASGHAEQAITSVRRVLRHFIDAGPDRNLFAQVQDHMVGSAPETYETSLAVAQQHVELASCEIDPSFIDHHLRKVRELEPGRLEQDLRSLVDPDQLHVAVVGQFDPATSDLAYMVRA